MNDLLSATPKNQQSENTPSQQMPSAYMLKLNKHKIVTIQACNDEGVADGKLLHFMFVDGDISIESQWQSPFESINVDNKMPSLMAGLQAGTLNDAVQNILEGVSNNKIVKGLGFDDGVKIAAALLDTSGLKGKSNFTKVNSTQVFLSASPIRLNLTLSLLAYKDALKEVEEPLLELQKMAMMKKLAESLTSAGEPFPSEIPNFVTVTYSGKTYKPMAIENVSAPINGATDANGNRLSASITLSLISYTSIDKTEWTANGIEHRKLSNT